MAHFIEIDDASDPRLSDYVQLRDTQLRHHLEAREGLFIAEGEKIIRRAIEAGHRPRSLMLAPRWVAGLSDLLDDADVDVYLVPERLSEEVTGFHVHRGALASLHRALPSVVDDLLGLGRLVICEDIVDHTNVGAIIRSSAALGWDGVLLSPRCADPLYRRAIKTSMGAVFSLPWARMDESLSTLAALRERGTRVVAAALTPDATELDQVPSDIAEGPLALLVGTEGAGLSDQWVAAADLVVKIPMSRGIDSLNVANAAAILMWELRRG